MTAKGLDVYSRIQSDELPCLALVLDRDLKKFDGSRFRVSENWSDAAARKIPTDKLPQGELDLSPIGGGGASLQT
jgi:hypothetical protein